MMKWSIAAVAVVALATSACNSPCSSCHAKQVPTQPRAALARQPLSAPVAWPVRSVARVESSPARTFTATPAPLARAGSASYNATCPVLVGNPISTRYTSEWKSRTIAFSSATAKMMWDADPARYAGNLPGRSGSAGDELVRPAAPVVATAPMTQMAPVTPMAPMTPALPRAAAIRPAAMAKPMPAAVLAPRAAAVPVIEQPSADGECEDCPGGVCRVPGR